MKDEGWGPDIVTVMSQVEVLQGRRWAFAWTSEGQDSVRAAFCRDGKLAQGRARTLSMAILRAAVCAVALERGLDGVGG